MRTVRLANGLRRIDNATRYDNQYKRQEIDTSPRPSYCFQISNSASIVRAVVNVRWMCAQPTKMQCLNTKIKEEDIGDDAYVGESSSVALSHSSTVAQQKVILSPRIEIHRIVKNQNHSAGMATTVSAQNGNVNAASRDEEIAYERNTSPMTDNIVTDAAGLNCGVDRIQQLPPPLPQQHQFVSPPNNCAVLHYREHRTETTSMALPQQRVHVIKDGRFYSTTTTAASSSPPLNGTASATTTSAAASGPTATSKLHRFYWIDFNVHCLHASKRVSGP